MSLDSLASPVPRGKFEGPQHLLGPLLTEFRAQWERTKAAAANTHLLSQQLSEGLAKSTGVDYSKVEDDIEAKEKKLRVLEERVWQVCEKRELRWNRAIQLDQFEPDVDKVKCSCSCGIIYVYTMVIP